MAWWMADTRCQQNETCMHEIQLSNYVSGHLGGRHGSHARKRLYVRIPWSRALLLRTYVRTCSMDSFMHIHHIYPGKLSQSTLNIVRRSKVGQGFQGIYLRIGSLSNITYRHSQRRSTRRIILALLRSSYVWPRIRTQSIDRSSLAKV